MTTLPGGRKAGRNVAAVAYDEKLAERVRDLLVAEPDLTERKMFGGLAFLLGGHMTVAAIDHGGLMVRVDRSDVEVLLSRHEAVEVVEMRGRQMTGWLDVPANELRTKRQLERWVTRSTDYVRTLPAKKA